MARSAREQTNLGGEVPDQITRHCPAIRALGTGAVGRDRLPLPFGEAFQAERVPARQRGLCPERPEAHAAAVRVGLFAVFARQLGRIFDGREVLLQGPFYQFSLRLDLRVPLSGQGRGGAGR